MKLFAAILVVLAVAGCGVAIDGTPPPYTDPGTPLTSGTAVGSVPTSCRYRGTGLFSLPDPHCSPGAINSKVTQSTIGSTICKSGWTSTVRPPESVTGPEKLLDMHAYGLTGPPRQYELDHIVSLELGGATNSYKNYYPEPDYPHREGFYLNPKDKLENLLNHMVCDGRMKLRTAQHTIATNWVSAYHRYFK